MIEVDFRFKGYISFFMRNDSENHRRDVSRQRQGRGLNFHHLLAAAASGRLRVPAWAPLDAFSHFDLAATGGGGATVLLALLEGSSHDRVLSIRG